MPLPEFTVARAWRLLRSLLGWATAWLAREHGGAPKLARASPFTLPCVVYGHHPPVSPLRTGSSAGSTVSASVPIYTLFAHALPYDFMELSSWYMVLWSSAVSLDPTNCSTQQSLLNATMTCNNPTSLLHSYEEFGWSGGGHSLLDGPLHHTEVYARNYQQYSLGAHSLHSVSPSGSRQVSKTSKSAIC